MGGLGGNGEINAVCRDLGTAGLGLLVANGIVTRGLFQLAAAGVGGPDVLKEGREG